MGILPSQHREADFGNGSYGFMSQEDAFNAIDRDDPPVGATFRINGEVYKLQYVIGMLEFVPVEE